MIPISATKFSPFLLFKNAKDFDGELNQLLERKKCFFFSRGADALYMLFKALKEAVGKEEVIIPAYTADTVYLPAKQAGCKVRLCDMSTVSFNMNLNHLESLVNSNTLAIVAVSLFGIPEDFKKVKDIADTREVFLIDDFCQAFGSKYEDKYVGSFGDASVLSFGKGKNFTTFNGGALFLNNEKLGYSVESNSGAIEEYGFFESLNIIMKTFALSMLSRPRLYQMFYKVLSSHRAVPAPVELKPKKMLKVQKRLGMNLLKEKDNFIEPRYKWGKKLHALLRDRDEFIIPSIKEEQYIAWNRFPVLVKDLNRRENIRKKLLDSGIESNYLYGEPIFEHYNLEVDREMYKNAIYMAEHLLTLPTNCFMTEKYLRSIEECFQKEI